MLQLPREVNPNEPIRASEWNLIVRYLRSITPRSSPDNRVITGPGGTKHQPRMPRSSPSGLVSGVAANPFQVISFSPVDGDTSGASGYTARFQPGMINGNIFPKVSSTYMWQLVATTVGSVTTYAFPTLTVNKGDYIYLQGTVTAGALTDVILTNGSTDPSTLETDSLTTYLIGTCDETTGALTQISTGNRTYVAAASYFSAGSRLIYHQWT